MIKCDKYTEEIIVQLNKPDKPSNAFLGKPGYYEVDDFKERDGGFMTQK